MAADRKAEPDAIEAFVEQMRQADRLAARVELRHRAVLEDRDARPDQRGKRRDVEPVRAKALGLAEPAPAVTPPAVERARFFSKVGRWANADWYELLLPPSPRVRVPEGCLVTGGDRAWRRTEVM